MVKKKIITMITTAAMAAVFGTALAAGGIGDGNGDGGLISELTCETVLAAESSNSSSDAGSSDKNDESGKSEESRLNNDSGGVYDFKDNKTNGTVTVTKEWSDRRTNESRPEPEIKISAKKPSKSTLGYTVTFHGNEKTGLAFADGSYVNEILYNSNGEVLDGTYKTLDKVGVGWYLDRNYTQKVDVKDDGTVKLKLSEDIELWAKVMTFDVASGYNFSRIIPDTVISVIFTDEKMPEEAQLIDNVDTDGDGGVVGWLEDDGQIMKISTQIKGIKAKAGQYCWSMFNSNKKLVNIDLSKLDMSETESVGYIHYTHPYYSTGSSGMFQECSALQSVILPSDMSNAINLGCMFKNCLSLKDISIYDNNILKIPKAECLSGMFEGCSSLEELNFSIEGAHNLSEMNYMFYNCKKLISIDMSKVKSTNNASMIGAFIHCEKLQDLALPSLILLKINDNNIYSSPFCYCYSLTTLDLTPLNTEGITSMRCMFYNCSSLTSLDLTPLDTTNVIDMAQMFSGCSSLASLDLTPLDTTNVTDMRFMFCDCESLVNLDLTPLNTEKTTIINGIFQGCSGLTSLDLTPLNTTNVIDMAQMFYGCSSLTSLDLTPLNTQNVTDIGFMFQDCRNLTSLDLTPLDTANVTNMYQMFSGCSGLKSLDLTPLNTQKVTSMGRMFEDCSGLTSLDLTPLNTQNVTSMDSMFEGCSGLTSLDLTPLNTENVTDMSSMFEGCSGLTSLDLTPLNTTNVTNIYQMFSDCSGLTSLNLTPLNTANVTNMFRMFYGCSGLTNLDLTPLDTAKVMSMSEMFSGCSNLTTFTTGTTFKFAGTNYSLPGTWQNTAGETFNGNYNTANFPSNVADTYTKISP